MANGAPLPETAALLLPESLENFTQGCQQQSRAQHQVKAINKFLDHSPSHVWSRARRLMLDLVIATPEGALPTYFFPSPRKPQSGRLPTTIIHAAKKHAILRSETSRFRITTIDLGHPETRRGTPTP